MKRIVHSFILLFVAMALVTQASAQASFSFEADTMSLTFTSNNDNLYNKVTNISASNIKLEWKVKNHDFPASWATPGSLGICDNNQCYDNANNQLLNGKLFTSVDYVPNIVSDFHLQMIGYLDASVPAGTHFITVNAKEVGGTYEHDITFIFHKWSTNVPGVQKSTEDVVLYPNPARTELNVTYNKNLEVRNLAIYNLLGKQVSSYRVSGSSAKLDIEKIPSGIYFIRLVDNTGRVVATRRFTHQ